MVEQIRSEDATSWMVSDSNVWLAEQGEGDKKGTRSTRALRDDIGSETGLDSRTGL